MRKKIFPIAVLPIMTLFLTVPIAGFAQTANPCKADLEKYCSHVTPGGGRLLRCYEEQKKNMSPACIAWAEGAKANAAIAKEACAKEIDLTCNSERGDPLAMVDCLQAHYVSLSPECVAQLNQFKYWYPQPAR